MQDVIFLLSEREYMKYRESIPRLNFDWWLRSPGSYSSSVANVTEDGSLNDSFVYDELICVRPALHIDKVKIDESKNHFVYCGITWVKIDKNIAISELPISRREFNRKTSNNYENSYIRNWLLNWYEERKNY